jgi:hypothetical protein
MYLTLSQIFVIIGLAFEVISIVYTAYSSTTLLVRKKDRKLKVLTDEGQPLDDIISKQNRTMMISILLVVVGVIFQGIAIFIV